MVYMAAKLNFQILESELEALLVEAELIRLHQPRYNILLKDDKSNIYLLITKEKYPKVLTIRKKDIVSERPTGTILGPFQSSFKLKEVLRLVRPIFPWCNQKQTGKACFYYHLDLCPGACLSSVTEVEYQQNIDNLIKFLKGKTKQVLADLQQELQTEVEKENFEKAATLRDQIILIKEVTDKNKRLTPDLILPALKQTLIEEQLVRLHRIVVDYLHLPKQYPLTRIEGYDVSNISGTNASVAMVTFTNGQADPENYRLFNIKTLNTPNDYGMMREAILRRQNHPEWGLPSLVIIDGGKGQLRTAIQSWGDSTPIISIAKNPDRLIIPIFEGQINKSRITGYHVLKLESENLALKLVQQIRDEAHRFSKKQHTRRRTKQMLQD